MTTIASWIRSSAWARSFPPVIAPGMSGISAITVPFESRVNTTGYACNTSNSLQNAAWIESKLLANLLVELGPKILVSMHRNWRLASCEPDKHVPSLATPFDDLGAGLAELADQFSLPFTKPMTLVSSKSI